MKLHHDDPTTGHRDADSTYLAVREHCYWPNMRRTCQQYVRCAQCLANKTRSITLLWTINGDLREAPCLNSVYL